MSQPRIPKNSPRAISAKKRLAANKLAQKVAAERELLLGTIGTVPAHEARKLLRRVR